MRQVLRLLPLLALLILFVGCESKSEQRAARYDSADCPTCKTGTCSYCEGSKVCQHCDGKGTRTSSTKNFTGKSINLIDYKEPCPFCSATGKCSYCEATGKCHTCKGSGKTSEWEPKSNAAKASAPVAVLDSAKADSVQTDSVKTDSTSAKATDSTK